MKKLSVALQWLVILGIAALVAYPFVKGRPVPDRHPEDWRSWQGFMALSYAGIGKGDPQVYPSPERLAEQLEALRAAGYRTITPEDALAFLREQAPLPPKALLLLFEGGRNDSVIYTTKPFQQTGFSGTLCLPSRAVNSRGAFFLRGADLRRIAKMGFWQVAAMGHEAIDDVPVGPDGTPGHFLSRRKWTEDGKESAAAFRQRVANDYATCLKTLEKQTGIRPILYVYPFADAGQGREADPQAAKINREQVTHLFQMAFVQAHQPFNGPGQDPYDLTRLRVPGNISGADMVRLLAQYAPRPDAATDIRASSWQVDGDVQFIRGGMEFAAGAAAWPLGSDNWSDVDVRATVRIPANAMAAIYARYNSPQSFLRVTLSPAGIRVQENQDGRMRTLHWQPEPQAENGPVDVRLLVKGARAWLWRGEEPLAGPLPLSSPNAQGRVGIASETGSFRVDAYGAKPLDTAFAVASGFDRFPETDHAATKALIVPLERAGDEAAQAQRRTILAAAAQGTEVVPLLPAGEDPAATLAELQTLLDHPITRSLINRVAVPSPNAEILQGLRALDLAVIGIYSAADLAQGGFEQKTLLPDDMILVEGSESESLVALDKLLASYPAYRTIAFLDPAKCRELGIARAVRYGPE